MNEYTEQELVEKPAIELFETLGYDYLNCYNEQFGDNNSLGRKSSYEVILTKKLRHSLINLNPDIPVQGIEKAIEKITEDRSTKNPVIANKEIYQILKNGILVEYENEEGIEEEKIVDVIDFENPDNNDFFLASQFWITGEMYRRRADLVGFINGIPLIFIELKATYRNLKGAYYNNFKDYKSTIPQLFWYNAFVILSNGSETKVGTISSEYEHFNEWKRINSEGEKGVVSLDTVIKGVCDKERFLDILENFILYKDEDGASAKILAKNHQYLGVNKAIKEFNNRDQQTNKLGIFWHTQGSGKSFSMIFFSQKILRKFPGNYTFVIVTDRKSLDKQIYENFWDTGAVTKEEVHADDCDNLMQLLKEDHRYVFTLIHKFQTEKGENYPVLSERSDIIVMTDEAHRTQYDLLAMNMRRALPNAAFLAFTATPLIVEEEETRNTFGNYVSIYDFQQSIEDGATVPLYYEKRVPEVQINKEYISKELERILEEAMLDSDEEQKLFQELTRQYEIITREDRLEKIAADIVEHFINRGFLGKGMVVSIDKRTTVRMFDKVEKYWNKKLEKLKSGLNTIVDDRKKEKFEDKIEFMQETDMAVVVSSEQNEIDKYEKYGLDIKKHRIRMNNENLAKKFKDPDDKFRLVFVCSMWMTGFDAPCLSTIYLDKPMKNHTLMQAIARANRVFGNKPNGLIVDYFGVFRNLKDALAIYAQGIEDKEIENKPVKPKSELIKELRRKIKETKEFLSKNDVDFNEILDSEQFQRIKLIDEAVDKLLQTEEIKNRYITLSNETKKLFKAILPDTKASEFKPQIDLIENIRRKINTIISPNIDITDTIMKVEDALDESLRVDPVNELDVFRVDLNKLDFDKLLNDFNNGRKNTKAEKLKTKLKSSITKLVKLNRSRKDFLDRLLELINEYNAGTINIDIYFKKLLKIAEDLKEEERRKISENLSEEELAVFDLIYKPEISENEKKKIKQAAKDLLKKIKKEKLVIDWRKKQTTQAAVLVTIKKYLDQMLPGSYSQNEYNKLCLAVFQHIYDSYYGPKKSVYSQIS